MAIIADSLAMEMASDSKMKDHQLFDSRFRSQDDSYLDYDSGIDRMNVSVFEFQKSERAPQRAGLAPFSKPAPSKWDDAQKWIASPTSSRSNNGQPQGHTGVGLRRNSTYGHGSRQPAMKVVVEVPDQTLIPWEDLETKRMESSQENKEIGGQKIVTWEADPYTSIDNKTVLMIEDCVKESASKKVFIMFLLFV